MSGSAASPILLDSDCESVQAIDESSSLHDCPGKDSTMISPLKIVGSPRHRHINEDLDRECEDSDWCNLIEDDFTIVTPPSKKRLKFTPHETASDSQHGKTPYTAQSNTSDQYPVYEHPPTKYSAEAVIKILLDPNLDSSKICHSRPTEITHSSTYVVDVTKLESPDDIKNDNFGVWHHSGSHPQPFVAHIDKDGLVQVDKRAPGVSGDNVIYLRRLHSVHPSNKQFKRMIAFLSDGENSPHHLCLVVYRIPPGFVPSIKRHGNSKSDVPFHPTWASTKQCIKNECLIQGPDSTMSTVSVSAGGIVGASAPGMLPRDAKQVSNFKNKVKQSASSAADDELFSVMQQAYSDDPSHKFIRAVNAAPEPAVIVATSSQLQDLARFCTSSFESSILTVDPTFCLGDFDVTLITTRHLFLQSKRFKQSPVLVGPACIHYKKSFSTYLFFASTLVGQCRDLAGIRAIGTDGELALIDAFKHEFGFAQHLTCFIHVRRNVKDKLHEYNISSQLSNEVLDDIFGKKMGSVYVKGLVDSTDTDDFDEKVDKLLRKWVDSEHTSACDIGGFINWFQTYKVPVIRDSMIAAIREECGLGSPPAAFTTNASETVNYLLKHKVNYKRSELPEFLDKLRQLIQDQQREVEKAVIGRGKYELRSHYHSWYIPESKWFSMSPSQCTSHLNKFAGASLIDIAESEVNEIRIGRDVILSSTLSVQLDTFASEVRVPRTCLEGIWNKAAELLKTKDAIAQAPGVVDGYFVLSYSGRRPHLIVQKKGGTFACDSDCPNWKGLGICAHSVAVAEQCSKLPQLVKALKQSKKQPNITSFAEATMPKGRGRKGSVAPRRKSKPDHTPVETMVESPALTRSCQQTQSPPVTHQSQVQPYNSWPSSSTYFPPFSPPTWQYPSYCYQSSPAPPSHPFVLCQISGNIKICIGCRNSYAKRATPPNDLCIKHQEWREYSTSSSPTVTQSRFGNVYYHFSPECVWLRCSWFIPSQLQIPDDLGLQQAHKDRLSGLFNINI